MKETVASGYSAKVLLIHNTVIHNMISALRKAGPAVKWAKNFQQLLPQRMSNSSLADFRADFEKAKYGKAPFEKMKLIVCCGAF